MRSKGLRDAAAAAAAEEEPGGVQPGLRPGLLPRLLLRDAAGASPSRKWGTPGDPRAMLRAAAASDGMLCSDVFSAS